MKSNLDKLFKTDDSAIWMMITDEAGFLVSPWKESNPKMKSAMATFFKPFARQIELETVPNEKAMEIQVKMFVHACLHDWKGIEIDGALTAYDPEVAVEFLKGLPDLFKELWTYCRDMSNYRADLGNS